MAQTISFKPKQVTKKLLSALPERSKDVIVSRFGLSKEKPATLDAIGQRYQITRERVRQIENQAIKLIQESDNIKKEGDSFVALENAIRDLGGILTEKTILESLAPDEETKNHLYFMLTVGTQFTLAKDDKDFARRWFVDHDIAKEVENALKTVHQKVRPSDILTEEQMIDNVKQCLVRVNAKYRSEDTILRWLELSQCLVRNPLREWGRDTAPGIKVKNIRDYAYLALKKNGSPMHFSEVAKAIRDTFGKRAHNATTHNELIKDSRFVLVGRGMYALSEWGYRKGPVAEIITHILRERGPLSKKDLIDAVLTERYVKINTIIVNLQNPAFVKNSDGTYALKKKA